MSSNAQCRCSKCLSYNDCDSKFCIHCGSKMPLQQSQQHHQSNNTSKKKCAKCGYTNESDTKFCIQCGNNKFFENSVHEENESVAGYIVILLAYIAKGDDVISKQEATLIAKILDEISLGDTAVREALKEVFNRSKNKIDRNHKYYSHKLYNEIGAEMIMLSERKELLEVIGMYFMSLVYIEGSLNAKQNIIVNDILKNLQFTDSMIRELHEEFKQEQRTDQDVSNDNNYKILGCKPSDSDDAIKRAYRELAKQYHPDTLSGKDIHEAILILATEKLKEINSAYEKIKKQRGLK